MKSIYFLFIPLALVACSGQETEDANTEVDSLFSEVTVEETTDLTNNGKSVEYHPNGNIKMEGNLNDNGQREGLWIAYYEDGTKWSESYYVDGLRDGHNLSFYPNGQVRYIGEYKNDQKVGTWKFYAEDGSLETEETY